MKSFQKLIFLLILISSIISKNLRDLEYDNLFEISSKKSKPRKMAQRKTVQRKRIQITNANKIQKNQNEKKIVEKIKNRKLTLDWFDDSEGEIKKQNHQDNIKKLMDLLKLANGFKGDPNFDVKVHIKYKNEDSVHPVDNQKKAMKI